ncbi:phage terminase small subunit [Ruminococcaceae bacterium D5]|nr:phage terminase small subunit [Ruminococcaceae bacterium D5]
MQAVRTLTEREEKFCREYCYYYNATRAAIIAGYGRRKDGTINEKSAAVQGCKLMKRPEIRERIDEISKNAAREAGATPYYVAKKLKTTADRCLQEVKPKMAFNHQTRRLEETGEFTFNASGAVRALKVLADINGMCRPHEEEPDEKTLEISLKVIGE